MSHGKGDGWQNIPIHARPPRCGLGALSGHFPTAPPRGHQGPEPPEQLVGGLPEAPGTEDLGEIVTRRHQSWSASIES